MANPPDELRGGPMRRWCLAAALFAVLYLPFVNKPVHIDDANFLMLAEGAARDPWRPHRMLINWSGVTEPAFDILANPPGIAWWLAPVRHCSEWVLHTWMLPWLALSAWGCHRLGRQYLNGSGFTAALFLLTCPVIVIAAHALTPDLPLFACMTAGVGGFVTSPRARWAFALLAGCAALFRYSGGTVVPLLVLIGWQHAGWRGAAAALWAIVPLALLALHDLDAYGKVHLLVMFASQNDPQARPALLALHNGIAGLAMLGGAGVLPLLVWRRESVVGALIGIGIGLNAAFFSGQSAAQAGPTIVFTAAGVSALSLSLCSGVRDPGLSAWAVGGASFFLLVRFAAVRYWAAFVPGAGLLALRNARASGRWIAAGIVVNVVVSLGVAIDDYRFAQCCKSAAEQTAGFGNGTYSGHWGWQHYLAANGWSPIERDGEPASLHAYPRVSDPQLPDRSICLEVVARITCPDHWPGPRVHSLSGRAAYHAGGFGSYAPWTFSDEPYETVTILKRCDAESRP